MYLCRVRRLDRRLHVRNRLRERVLGGRHGLGHGERSKPRRNSCVLPFDGCIDLRRNRYDGIGDRRVVDGRRVDKRWICDRWLLGAFAQIGVFVHLVLPPG